jgi:predicted dehydrogenase
MTSEPKALGLAAISRRDFLVSSATLGAGLMLGKSALGQGALDAGFKEEPINVALIGVGIQGNVLKDACLNIPGARFKAVCDIWPYRRDIATRRLAAYGHQATGYEDYREMLAKEKGLNAVLVATPDWMHAEHANACMEAGLHVYCETVMSNALDGAKSMVLAQRKTGKLLQIGHQRRSNPRYLHAIDALIHKENLLGRVTHAYGQWNRSKAASEDLVWPKGREIPDATLAKYGYASGQHFLNWRWYKKYGGGPIVDLGSQQIDLYPWVFGARPTAVTADGGVDFYPQHEWFDNVMAIYEFATPQGGARAFYQALTTTGYGGFSEAFMGMDGTIQISEVVERGNWAQREANAGQTKWDELARRGMLVNPVEPLQPSGAKNIQVDVRVTSQTGRWPLPIELSKPAHQPHLENFFDAIRHGTPLNCPAVKAYETAVIVLAANRAVETHAKIQFKPEDFVV